MGFEIAYDPGENIKIVKTIEKYPVIYDTVRFNPIEFRRLQDKSWAKVALELGISESYCKSRWTNIRGCYKRYLRHVAERKAKKPYYLAKYLHFIRPFTRISQSRIPRDDSNSDKQTQDDEPARNEIEVKLLDSDGEEESFIIPTEQNELERESTEDMSDPDWLFLSSLLPDFCRMNEQQKSKFRNSILTSIDTILYGEDL